MFKRPSIALEVYEIPKDLKGRYWNLFKKHHYLGETLNKAARCWVAYLWGNPVAFNSVLAMPSGSLKNAWREENHRAPDGIKHLKATRRCMDRAWWDGVKDESTG